MYVRVRTCAALGVMATSISFPSSSCRGLMIAFRDVVVVEKDRCRRLFRRQPKMGSCAVALELYVLGCEAGARKSRGADVCHKTAVVVREARSREAICLDAEVLSFAKGRKALKTLLEHDMACVVLPMLFALAILGVESAMRSRRCGLVMPALT